MSRVTVYRSADDPVVVTADGWSVEDGALYLRQGGDHAAVFAAGQWAYWIGDTTASAAAALAAASHATNVAETRALVGEDDGA